MKWFRLYSSVLHDPKVQRLPADVFKGWVNLLCLANESEPRGVLPDTDTIAWALHLSTDETVTLLATLHATGLLDAQDDDEHVLTPHNWDARQFHSDDVNARVARWRDARKPSNAGLAPSPTGRNVTRNVECNAPRGDTDTDTEERERSARAGVRTRTREAAVTTTQQEATSADAAAPGALSLVKSKKKTAEPDPLHEAFAAKLHIGTMTASERRAWRQGLTELRDVGITPEDVPRLVDQYRLKYGTGITCTPSTIARNFSQLGVSPDVYKPNGTHQSYPAASASPAVVYPADYAERIRALANAAHAQ